MPLARDARLAVGLLRKALATRRARTDLRRALAERGPLPRNRFRIAVYFADGPVNMYQIRQWYAPLQELAREWPVVVIARAIRGADALLRDDALPVAYAPTVRDVEQVLDEQDIRIVFYVNQNTRNFQMFRYGRRWHVFINHGESDKMYMTTNQFTAYDYAFVASRTHPTTAGSCCTPPRGRATDLRPTTARSSRTAKRSSAHSSPRDVIG